MANWDARFLRLAFEVAGWSKDPSTKVGAVLVDADRRVIGLGFNGFPRGVDDSSYRLNDRPRKYLRTVHAEANAVLNAVASTKGATAYVTHHPCAQCAGVLIQAGAVRIVCPYPEGGFAERFEESILTSREMLHEANVTLDYVSGEDSPIPTGNLP